MVLQSSLAISYSRAIERVCYKTPHLLQVGFIFPSEKVVSFSTLEPTLCTDLGWVNLGGSIEDFLWSLQCCFWIDF